MPPTSKEETHNETGRGEDDGRDADARGDIGRITPESGSLTDSRPV